ncbi:hypothetical protein HDU98_011832 [Podochytrium sp. JEL0797]|nr:hypothetical protein HDU98_011832 [Podochytrium sp. JEL0797]
MSPIPPRCAEFDAIHEQLTAPGQLLEQTEAVINGNKFRYLGVPLELEAPGIKLILCLNRIFANAPPNLRVMFQMGSALHSEKPFLVCNNRTFSFNQMQHLTIQFANALNLPKGARVALCMRNSPEWLIGFWATVSIGGISAAINSTLHAKEMEWCIRDSDPQFCIINSEIASKLVPFMKKTALVWIICAPSEMVDEFNQTHSIVNAVSFDAFCSRGSMQKELPDVNIDPEDDATILYTSGTTGLPKGVLQTHRGYTQSVMARSWSQNFYSGLLPTPPPDPAGGATIILHATPFFHTMGLSVSIGCWLLGAKIILLPKWDATQALRLFNDQRVTAFIGVPTMLVQILNHPDFTKFNTSSLSNLTSGGAPPTTSVFQSMTSKVPKASRGSGYGLTETNSIGSILSSPLLESKSTSAGIVSEPNDIMIVKNAEGHSLDASKTPIQPVKRIGDVGEIAIRGPTVFKEYWRNPEATHKSKNKDGWFLTGDIGRIDTDGCLYILDRAKDMIIRGGENIFCAEVENVISNHPQVLESTVLGLPDAMFGETVLAVVLVNRRGVTAEEIMNHCKQSLALYKCPVRVEFWPLGTQLPRNAAGKVLKNVLKEKYSKIPSKL